MAFGGDEGPIWHINFEDSASFLQALNPSSRLWSGSFPNWVFRGQAKESWSLLPSLHRDEFWVAQDLNSSELKWIDVILREYCLLKIFVVECDGIGLSVPGDSMALREKPTLMGDSIESRIRRLAMNQVTWPYPELVWPLALAQHSGLKTCLLDWTENAKMAAFFAGEISMDNNYEEHLAVWAINQYLLNILFPYDRSEHQEKLGLHLLRIPRAGNTNLTAQKGLFLLTEYPRVFSGSEFKPTSIEDRIMEIDEYIDSQIARNSEKELSIGYNGGKITSDDLVSPLLIKLTLAPQNTKSMMIFLDHEGVNHLSIYPSPHSARALFRARYSYNKVDIMDDE